MIIKWVYLIDILKLLKAIFSFYDSIQDQLVRDIIFTHNTYRSSSNYLAKLKCFLPSFGKLAYTLMFSLYSFTFSILHINAYTLIYFLYPFAFVNL